MFKKNKKISIFIIVSIFFFASPVFAQYLIEGETFCEMWTNAFNLGISFLGVAGLVGVIWGGFGYLISFGNPEKMKENKETIWGSVTGMFIGLMAYVFFSLINPYMLECKVKAPMKISIEQGEREITSPGTEMGGVEKCDAPYKSKSKYSQIIKEQAEKYGADPFLVETSIWHESGYNNKAVGPAGERSFGQFMPGTFVHAVQQWGGQAPPSCLKQMEQPLSKPYDENTADGYCYNKYKGKSDPNCKYQGRDNSVRYSKACLDWIYADENRSIAILAAELASLKQRCGDNGLRIALAHNTGSCDGNNQRYASNHSIMYNKLCKYARENQ